MTRCTRSHPLATILLLCLCACSSAPPQTVAPREFRPAPRAAAEASFTQALKAMQEGNLAIAEQQFLALAAEYPAFSGPWTNLGILHAQAGQHERALGEFHNALRGNARNVVAMNWLGQLYSMQQDYPRALQWYERALAIQPDRAALHLNLAILHDTALRQPLQALAHYRRYRELAGVNQLIVDAWIRDIEARIGTVAAVATGGAR